LKTASAAATRLAGPIGEVSEPRAASIALRSELLTRTFFNSAAFTPEIFSPVRALIISPCLYVEQGVRSWVDQKAIVTERFKNWSRDRRPTYGELADRADVWGNLSSRNLIRCHRSYLPRKCCRPYKEQKCKESSGH